MIEQRIKSVQRALKQKKEPSAVIITSGQNRRYMTNIQTSSGYVIITPENKYFLTDSRYIEFAKKTLEKDYTVAAYPKNYDAKYYYRELLNKEQIKNILYEENYIYLKTKKYFDEMFEGFVLSESDNLIENMRKIKDNSEIENIKKAQDITDRAFEHILKIISSDINISTITETDIAVELEYFMKKNGAENTAFESITVSGKKSSYPHGKPENIKLSKGFLLMDFGAVYDGYCSDMTRTVCIGSPTEKMRDVYNLVLSSQLAALDKIKAGIEGVEVDRIARGIIRDAGFGENFGHSLGHSLGLEIHENPSFPVSETAEEEKARLDREKHEKRENPEKYEENQKKKEKDKFITAENVIITVEPGVYIENEFGVRIEDLVVIKQDGCENLTKSSKDLIVI